MLLSFLSFFFLLYSDYGDIRLYSIRREAPEERDGERACVFAFVCATSKKKNVYKFQQKFQKGLLLPRYSSVGVLTK